MKRMILAAAAVFACLSAIAQSGAKHVSVSANIELISITPSVMMHVSRSVMSGFGMVEANGVIYVCGKNALLFDTPANDTLTRDLVTFLSDSLGLTVTDFVPNHWHSDCMGGIGYLNSIGVRTWANSLTNETALKNGLPAADSSFTDSLIIRSGDREVRCYYPGPAHTADNIVVWIPAEKVLFAGCMVKDLHAGGLGNTSEADLSQWPVTIEKVISMFPDAQHVIPGHGKAGDSELLKHTLGLLNR